MSDKNKVQCEECGKDIPNGVTYYAIVLNREAVVGGSITVENSVQIQAYHKGCLPEVLTFELADPKRVLCGEPHG